MDDKDKIHQAAQARTDLQFTEDSSGIYLRTSSMDGLASFRQQSGLEPLQIRPANLEDVFLKLTGREISVDA